MKKIIFSFILFNSLLSNAQWNQIGTTINGQFATEESGTSTSLNADGTVIAIGAPNAFDATIRKGRVRIFQWNGTSWSQKGSDIIGTNQGDVFGESVSISADGNILAIGAPVSSPTNPPGYTRIFEWNGANWIQKGTDIIGEANGDGFGRRVSLNANGSILAIGASLNNGANGIFSGHCRIYEWNGSSWIQKGSDIDGEAADDFFGFSVSINSSGTFVAVGATGNDGAGNLFGHVRVFEWNGTAWIQKGTDIDGDSITKLFGTRVSIDGTGTTFIASGSSSLNTDIGSVKSYTWNGVSWVQKGQTLFGDIPNDFFGSNGLDINNDGSTYVAGAFIGSNDDGYVKIFKFIANSWVQQGSTIFGETQDSQFGRSASINGNGSIIAAGTPFNSGSLSNSGLVRVFENTTLTTSDFEISKISFYPNPTKNYINISSENAIEQITIFNLLGQEVLTKTVNSQEFVLDITNLSNGTYIAELNSLGKSQSVKLVKM